MYKHKTKCMCKCMQPIYPYIYIQNIYTQKHKTNLNAHPYLNIPIVKKHIKDNVKINCNLLCQKKVNSSSDSSSLFFNLWRNKGKDNFFFSNSCRPTRRNGKTSGFGNYFWLFKIASRRPSWVSVMNFFKCIVRHSWV